MNQAIKLNPSFSTAFLDRGIAFYDTRDYDRTMATVDPVVSAKPTYAVTFNERGASYENRREGDRIMQDANQPIRNAQFNAYAYSPDTFPAVTQTAVPVLAAVPAATTTPAPEPVRAPVPAARPEPRAEVIIDNVPMPLMRPPQLKQFRPAEQRPAQRQSQYDRGRPL